MGFLSFQKLTWNLNGCFADPAWTHTVGTIPEEARHLLQVTKEPCIRASNKKRIGNRLGDNGHAIQIFVATKVLEISVDTALDLPYMRSPRLRISVVR